MGNFIDTRFLLKEESDDQQLSGISTMPNSPRNEFHQQKQNMEYRRQVIQSQE